MPEARDRLSRPNNVAEAYARRRMLAERFGILPDRSESDRTPFRWGLTPLTGGVSGQQIGLTQFDGRTTIGGVTGRGLFGTPGTAYRRGVRSQNTPPSRGGGGIRRGRGGRTASRSVLPAWYPRTPLGDITHIVRAIERRRERLGESDGLLLGVPTPIRVYQDTADQDPSPSGAHLEHESLVTPKPKLAYKTFKPSNLGKAPMIFVELANRNSGDSEFITPQKKLLNSIDIIEKVVMQELNNLKRTPTAKKAEREKRVRTLMSMRIDDWRGMLEFDVLS
uniref:Protein polychome-like n=1 Tax=Tanacetum cinerariifolium TaxID=118510 RepID=A0A6L2P0I3_TANCI|nr:protein polychome-like [Tanacetum cinerariifolium]